jgi:hypothetical protein
MGCLALNASFEPLTILPIERALRLVIDSKAEVLEVDASRMFRSEREELPCPIVIRLVRFVHVPRRFRRQVTNTFLFARLYRVDERPLIVQLSRHRLTFTHFLRRSAEALLSRMGAPLHRPNIGPLHVARPGEVPANDPANVPLAPGRISVQKVRPRSAR